MPSPLCIRTRVGSLLLQIASKLAKTTSDASSASSSGSSQHPGGTHYWYGEHETNASGSSAGDYWGDADEFTGWTGGVGACSTDDFVDWRYAVRMDKCWGVEPRLRETLKRGGDLVKGNCDL